MVPPSTRMRGAPQSESSWFHWEFRSEKPVRTQADELPDSKALIVGAATAEQICGGIFLWSDAERRIDIDGADTFVPSLSVTALAGLFKRALC